jgi:glycosyltransferase involved in cell wall biosynthesis
LYAGRLDIEKGVAVLLRAFARLRAEVPTVRLRIAGQGPRRLTLEKAAGEGVEFLGWVPPGGLDALYAQTWALVTPSLWAEPQGLVALEALIRGVPVVASRSGGLAEMVEHGVSGLLFPNGDEEELLRCLREVIAGRAFPDHRVPGPIVRAVQERFSLERHTRHMRRIFTEVLA